MPHQPYRLYSCIVWMAFSQANVRGWWFVWNIFGLPLSPFPYYLLYFTWRPTFILYWNDIDLALVRRMISMWNLVETYSIQEFCYCEEVFMWSISLCFICGLKNIRNTYGFSVCIHWNVRCGLVCALSLTMFYEQLKTMRVLQPQDEMFCG